MSSWSVVYKKAIQDDGTLLFPERLSQQFLDGARRTMGSYLFANQYQNEIIPEEDQTFRREWVKYYVEIPEQVNHFAFYDPAISEADTADYTGIVVVAVDCEQNWYVRYARRKRMNATEIIESMFVLQEKFQCQSIGVEDVAFQRVILHFAFEEMRRRQKQIPCTGVKRGADRTKEMRILSLVPRFEWGTLFLAQGQDDLELELAEFPRGSHDDLLDALSSIEQIASYPAKIRTNPNAIPTPNSPEYESWYIKQLYKKHGHNPKRTRGGGG